jgi:hypothetical protein
MENPFAINVQNFLNMILTDRTRFMARAKNLGIGSPQLEITNATYAATCKVNLEYFFVTLSETDRLLPEAELHTLLLKLLFEGAKTLPSEESRDEFVQLQRVLEFLA